jgi:LAGLIDADG-like domain/Homeodomain-like domain
MHPPAIRARARTLMQHGLNDCVISRHLHVPRSTVRDWRHRPDDRYDVCPRCWHRAKPIRFTAEDYAELLGLYLGDGCISDHERTSRLRIHLDAKYPGVIHDVMALLGRTFPANPVAEVDVAGERMVYVSLYSSHLRCLFPQHGLGKKHERRLRLEVWQQRLVEQAPWSLLRGLIRSDGCVFANRTGPYTYLSYDFSNKSEDIVEMFTMACRLVGVEYRITKREGLWRVRVNRRPSVDRMLANVGTKA